MSTIQVDRGLEAIKQLTSSPDIVTQAELARYKKLDETLDGMAKIQKALKVSILEKLKAKKPVEEGRLKAKAVFSEARRPKYKEVLEQLKGEAFIQGLILNTKPSVSWDIEFI